ncbi:MAG: alpha/beta hydrolase [Leptolyngbya sp. SIOISBB]|nr:alpha/beta hydrolase [Leptolyngbya sp. SIOISBB]
MMNKRNLGFDRWGWRMMAAIAGWGTAVALGTASAALSAERIEFFVGPFEPAIWIEDLEALAKDGTVTDRFRPFANRLSELQLEELRAFLNRSVDVDLITLSQFTYWQVGERFLDRAGQVVQTETFRNGSRALRAALLAAAADGEGVTPLEVMQEFPLEVIQLDYDLTRQIIDENQRFFADREEILAQLRAIAEAEATTLPPSDLFDPTSLGRQSWQTETLTFQNPWREGNIPFDLYLPQISTTEIENDSIPLIVLSHGVASGRNAFIYLAQHLASHGYAVVVPQHDDDSQKYFQFLAGVDRPPNPITLISRPQDISSVLDTLATLADTNPEYATLDFDNVGVFGHSLGGFTVLAAAGAELNFEQVDENCSIEDRDRPSLNPSLLVQCDLSDLSEQAPFDLRDERIKAVFTLNPPTSLFFGEKGLSQLEIPTLMMASTADIVVPAVPEQIEPYHWLQMEDHYLVVMEPATHFTFLEGDLTEGAIPLPSALLGPDPAQARPYLQALSLAFFNRHLQGQLEADSFLSQPYLDALGTDLFQVSIVRSR